jgi:hypothetical protein
MRYACSGNSASSLSSDIVLRNIECVRSTFKSIVSQVRMSFACRNSVANTFNSMKILEKCMEHMHMHLMLQWLCQHMRGQRKSASSRSINGKFQVTRAGALGGGGLFVCQ